MKNYLFIHFLIHVFIFLQNPTSKDLIFPFKAVISSRKSASVHLLSFYHFRQQQVIVATKSSLFCKWRVLLCTTTVWDPLWKTLPLNESALFAFCWFSGAGGAFPSFFQIPDGFTVRFLAAVWLQKNIFNKNSMQEEV